MTTTQSRNSESSVNVALGNLLRGMLPSFVVRSEQTRIVSGHLGLRPDILITAVGRSPVVVEAEHVPASGAEADARARLGRDIAGEARPVESAIALRYPDDVGNAYDLDTFLAEAHLSYCIVYENGGRFPQSGWLEGTAVDLADLIRLVSVPQKAVAEAADDLQQGIDSAASVLNQMPETRPDINPAIARRLNLSDVPQMRRMSCAIIANAMLFHERLAGQHGIKPLSQICGPGAGNPQSEILQAWAAILEINYLDIFNIARDIVAELPTREAAQILNIISFHVLNIASRGVNNDHDLTGQVFQRLIADRKYLATFYTLPASADLLARLAVDKMDGVDWSDAAGIGRLRIADFACGTGALLSAVYEQITARHERAGGRSAQLHPAMLEDAIYGCDVMPSAVHITGSTLAGLQPEMGFRHSNLRTMPYGRQEDGEVRIGSLELLHPDGAFANEIPDDGFDLVIMNPPFTRATNHEGAHAAVTNPAFAAFDASRDDQADMGRRINEFGRGTCYHGNAGIASAFAGLAHRKLKPGGVLALVLPLSAASGLSWQRFRRMLGEGYTDLTVLSIAANGREMSLSSDTGMAECLVVARKRDGANNRPASRAQFTSLHYRPHGVAQSAAISQSIIGASDIRSIEDGPFGGTQLPVGDDIVGAMLKVPQGGDGANWASVRMLDYSLAQTAHALTQSKLWLPAQPEALDLPMATLDRIGKLGLVDRDITGPASRGPFTKIAPSPTATYTALWNHDAEKETRIICEPDSQLQVRQGMESKAAEVWATASRVHVNRDFRFNSQPLAVAFTERESIGGRCWPNVIFDDKRLDYALAVWSNSTLGLLCYWWHSNRQQPGRGIITIRAAESLPALDLGLLTDEQLATTQAIFEEFREKELQPAYLAHVDENRALLDRRVVCDLMGFDDGIYRAVRFLAAKWCAEPSVHGGKGRPDEMAVVITNSGVPANVVPPEPMPSSPRLSLTADELGWLEEYRRQLKERFPERIEDIIVYGSHARGISGLDVDFNILVIVDEEDGETQEEIGDLAYDIDLNSFFVAPSIRSCTSEEWAENKISTSSLYRRVVREGISVL